MATSYNLNFMSQLVFKFPFKTKYYEQDFYVSANNFAAYKLIESWPNWPGRWVNIYGPKGCGKTHLSNILRKKIDSIVIIDAKNIDDKLLLNFENKNCIIIDNYEHNINENLFYSMLNHVRQLNIHIVVNSFLPLKDMKFKLKDLKSRASSFIDLGIELPTDELLSVIISKYFSDKQIDISPKIADYIIKNIDRSYEKVFGFIKDIDELSLSSGKSININLIKKVLINE